MIPETKQKAPHANRTIQIGAKTRVNMADAGHPLASYVPQTKLGAIGLDLAMAASSSYLTIMATAGYVYSVTELKLPNPTFGSPPSGITIDPATLQTAWTSFNTNYALIQGKLDTFMDTTPGSANPTSILSQLEKLPSTIKIINGASIVLDFASKDSAGLEILFGAINTSVLSLKTALQKLGTDSQSATTTLTTASSTGVLKQLYDAYATDVQNLKDAITAAQNTIDADNKKIIGEGFGAATSVAVGLVGLINFWNPVGWVMMAGGAVGAYFAIEEIEKLKSDVETLKNTIKEDTIWETDYASAATAMQATIGSIQGFASMQAAAELELLALENVLSTLSTDLLAAVSDLQEGTPDWTAAQKEWNTVMTVAEQLGNVTAYIWPSPTVLSNPTGLTSSGSGLYQISSSGTASYLANGGTAWFTAAERTLSIATGGSSTSTVVGIDGAPAAGAAGKNVTYATNYFVKTYNQTTNVWTTISSFPAAQVATDGTNIYAIDQTVSRRTVKQYSGSGTTWTSLPALPNSDAPSNIAIANSKIFALSINSQTIYYYNGSSWVAISTSMDFMIMSGNGTYMGVVDTTNNSYLWDASTNAFKNASAATSTFVVGLAQQANGNQLVINKTQVLYSINNAAAPVATQLATDVVGITAVGGVFRVDETGAAYVLTTPASNTWTKLPVVPAV